MWRLCAAAPPFVCLYGRNGVGTFPNIWCIACAGIGNSIPVASVFMGVVLFLCCSIFAVAPSYDVVSCMAV